MSTEVSKLVMVWVRHYAHSRDETKPVWVRRTDVHVYCPCCGHYMPIPWDKEL